MSVRKIVSALCLLVGVFGRPLAAQSHWPWAIVLRDTAARDTVVHQLLRAGIDSSSVQARQFVIRFTVPDTLAHTMSGWAEDAPPPPWRRWIYSLQRDPPHDMPLDSLRTGLGSRLDAAPDPGLIWAGAPGAWALGVTGLGAGASDIDTGFDRGDFSNPFITIGGGHNWAVIFGPGGDDWADDAGCNGHGTHTAGTIAGNTASHVGMAPDATLWITRTVDVTGGCPVYSSGVSMGLSDAVTHPERHIRAANVSLGFSLDFTGIATFAHDNGVALCAAYGNNGDNFGLAPGRNAPALGIVSLGGTGKSGFSSYGTNVFGGEQGEGIWSLLVGGGFTVMSGTSMATPHCTGHFTLLFSMVPLLPLDSAMALTRNTCDPLGNASDPGMPAHDDVFGCGQLRIDRAVRALIADGHVATVDSGQRVLADTAWHCEPVGGDMHFVTLLSDSTWVRATDDVPHRTHCLRILPNAPSGTTVRFSLQSTP